MGDLADYFIDMGVEQECNFFRDKDDMDADGDDYFCRSNGKMSKTCKYCGKTDLTWGETSNGFRLFENGAIHICNGYYKKHGHNTEINDDIDDDSNSESKPFIGKIQLGRRNNPSIISREIVKSPVISDATVVYDWNKVKTMIANKGPGNYVEVVTTTINGKIAWLVKLKVSKSSKIDSGKLF